MTLLTQIISRIAKEYGFFTIFSQYYNEKCAINRIKTITSWHLSFSLMNILDFNQHLLRYATMNKLKQIDQCFRGIVWGALRTKINVFCLENNIQNNISISRKLDVLNTDNFSLQLYMSPWNFILYMDFGAENNCQKIYQSFRSLISQSLIGTKNGI